LPAVSQSPARRHHSEVPIIDSNEGAAAIIPIRRGCPSATLTIAGRSVLDGTIRALRAVPSIGPIALALEGIEQAACLSVVERPEDLELRVTETLSTRWLAIEAALELVGDARFVVVHEPDRPLISASWLSSVLQRSDGVEAAMTAVPAHDTIKCVAGSRIVGTIPRETLHISQSPWIFRRDVLARAVRQAIAGGWEVRHELELARRAGIRLQLIEGHRFNQRIASATDARYAEITRRLQGAILGTSAAAT
jgi:2-C-methyl-D-erythritol 4-phosphate cytidylyltransferase